MSGDLRAIAFYLPQYHPIPENDAWWGAGFTDWVNVRKAAPRFAGHWQPHQPGELGYYDLRDPALRQAQADLARGYGIHGFCYHHYWFAGRRLLEQPFEAVLASGQPDFPFCLCWANENWTRRWDGQEAEILIQQQHSPEDDRAFIRALLPAFRDRRYIRIEGRPLLLVYRTDILPDPAGSAAIWREETMRAGLGDPFLVRAETFGDRRDPREIGFDASVEFPPHGNPQRPLPPLRHPRFAEANAAVLDYELLALNYLDRKPPDFRLFRGVMPSWDNSARRDPATLLAYVFVNADPDAYRRWLQQAAEWTAAHRAGEERLVFINAWNEWAEGCHLEPDERQGRAYLEATQAALGGVAAGDVRPPAARAAWDAERRRGYGRAAIDRRAELVAADMDRPASPLRETLAAFLLAEAGPFPRTRQMVYLTLRGMWRGVSRR